jgi:hypothetical protein
MNSGATLLNGCPRPGSGGPGAFARQVAGARVCDPQHTPCKSKPQNCFDFPSPSARCGSQSRAPRQGAEAPIAIKPVTDRGSGASPAGRGNPLQAPRADTVVASPSQNQSKLRRSSIAWPPHVRIGRFLICRRSGISGECRNLSVLPFIIQPCALQPPSPGRSAPPRAGGGGGAGETHPAPSWISIRGTT